MRRAFSVPLVTLMILALTPGWSGEQRLDLLVPGGAMTATPVVLDPADPARVRVGRLTFLGGVALASRDPAFGGFSSLSVAGDRFVLLSDGGNIVRFAMGADWRPRDVAFANLPAGPGTGWEKRDRDSESMARDPATGRIWVGFERANAIWRYAPGFARAERRVAPAAMAAWPVNGGPESLVRLADGGFLTIAETARPVGGPADTRMGLMFPGDPTAGAVPWRFAYRPYPHYDVSDATELPDGRLLIMERRFALPYRWSNRLVMVDRARLAPGAVVTGDTIATLAAPLIHDNFEGVAAVREGDATMLWIVSDDNQSALQRSLLLKFRLD